MKKRLLILLCLPMIGFGQNVNIPDANFKAYLVGNSSINTNGDTEIQLSEATAFNGAINCSSMGISDLTGIEALTALHCQLNQLTSIDVSQNTVLHSLYCYNNQLTNLDVSNNTYLWYLNCCGSIYLGIIGNQITNLNVSGATALTWLHCSSNQLSNIDVSNNTALSYFSCGENQLTSLDVRNGNNINFSHFWSATNPNLNCINVDNSSWSTVNWTNIDPQHYFSNNCSGTVIEEHVTNKELLKITDLLGRETKGKKNA